MTQPAVPNNTARTNARGKKKQRTYNREFQKGEVIRFLVKKEALPTTSVPLKIPGDLFTPGRLEGYLCYLYHARDDREYEEGFGPSVIVKVGGEETIWKRSRNKWNPFEKIRTLSDVQNAGFTIIWDRYKINSYYLTERMYYYLDREKHKEKYDAIRAKLYITRLHQVGKKVFLLQFIMEKLTDEEIQRQKDIYAKKVKKREKGKQQAANKHRNRENAQGQQNNFRPANGYSPNVPLQFGQFQAFPGGANQGFHQIAPMHNMARPQMTPQMTPHMNPQLGQMAPQMGMHQHGHVNYGHNGFQMQPIQANIVPRGPMVQLNGQVPNAHVGGLGGMPQQRSAFVNQQPFGNRFGANASHNGLRPLADPMQGHALAPVKNNWHSQGMSNDTSRLSHYTHDAQMETRKKKNKKRRSLDSARLPSFQSLTAEFRRVGIDDYDYDDAEKKRARKVKRLSLDSESQKQLNAINGFNRGRSARSVSDPPPLIVNPLVNGTSFSAQSSPVPSPLPSPRSFDAPTSPWAVSPGEEPSYNWSSAPSSPAGAHGHNYRSHTRRGSRDRVSRSRSPSRSRRREQRMPRSRSLTRIHEQRGVGFTPGFTAIAEEPSTLESTSGANYERSVKEHYIPAPMQIDP